MAPLVGVAAGWLIAGSLSAGFGPGLEGRGLGLLPHVVFGATVVVFVMVLRRRRAAQTLPPRRVADGPSDRHEPTPAAITEHDPGADASLAEGVRDIRRLDPKFEPTRFTGYIEMVFRAAHTARMGRDVGSLRDRVTPELYGELQAQSDRSRALGHAGHVEQMEIRARVTEAWHEDGRDYVTAYIDGSMLAYTVDEATGALVDGSRTALENVEAFWTFTRPAGLNPWMLAAIQTP